MSATCDIDVNTVHTEQWHRSLKIHVPIWSIVILDCHPATRRQKDFVLQNCPDDLFRASNFPGLIGSSWTYFDPHVSVGNLSALFSVRCRPDRVASM